jgi:hypothetical protein
MNCLSRRSDKSRYQNTVMAPGTPPHAPLTPPAVPASRPVFPVRQQARPLRGSCSGCTTARKALRYKRFSPPPYPDFHAMRVAVPPLVRAKTTRWLILTMLFYIVITCRTKMAKIFPLSESEQEKKLASEDVARDFSNG